MMRIATETKPSGVCAGLGLFAAEHVAAGTVIWKFVEGFDVRVHISSLNDLLPVQQLYIDKYFWREGSISTPLATIRSSRITARTPIQSLPARKWLPQGTSCPARKFSSTTRASMTISPHTPQICLTDPVDRGLNFQKSLPKVFGAF